MGLMFRKNKVTVSIFNILALNSLIFFSSRRLFTFYITFELSLIPMLVIILVNGYQPERLLAVIWLVVYTIVGSLPLLFLMAGLYYSRGSSRSYLQQRCISGLLVLPFILAFLVKLPVFGFHLWLPKAHVQAPVTGRIFLAAVLLKIGGYGLYFVKPLIMLGR